MSADIAAHKIEELRNEIARLKNQTNWVCKCGGTDCEGQRQNAKLRAHAERVGQANDQLVVENNALRAAAVEVCALARVWVTVWGDKLSAESIKRLGELEKQILKDAQP